MVCNECELRGDITIGSMTVIHPRASIIAEAGPIIIGECNIVEEQARITNRLETDTLYLEFRLCDCQGIQLSLNEVQMFPVFCHPSHGRVLQT
jgi:hypothetical protein